MSEQSVNFCSTREWVSMSCSRMGRLLAACWLLLGGGFLLGAILRRRSTRGGAAFCRSCLFSRLKRRFSTRCSISMCQLGNLLSRSGSSVGNGGRCVHASPGGRGVGAEEAADCRAVGSSGSSVLEGERVRPR